MTACSILLFQKVSQFLRCGVIRLASHLFIELLHTDFAVNKACSTVNFRIESIIDLIAGEEDGEVKTAMIRSLAIYMRQQYLIWNKDTVSDETIFQDIERLSGGRVHVPEGIELSKISADASFARPGMNLNFGSGNGNGKNGKFNRGFRGKKGKK